jgi:hypothetical protein
MADIGKVLGIAALGIAGYWAYNKYKGTAVLAPITTPGGAIVPPFSPPGMTPPTGGTLPTSTCSTSSSTLQSKALSWVKGSDRSYGSLVNFLGGYPMGCRAQLGYALIAAGASASAVRTALAAVGITI